jgi:hypothetical protein
MAVHIHGRRCDHPVDPHHVYDRRGGNNRAWTYHSYSSK